MALKRRKILKQMIDRGHGTTTIPADSGGTLTGDLVGIHSFLGEGTLCATDFSGADIGAQINAAIAAITTTSGRIYIPSGIYSFSTTIQLPIASDLTRIIIEGAGSGENGANNVGSTILKYTGTTAAINQVVTNASYQNHPGAILRDFILDGTGAGSAAIGVKFGGTNYSTFEDITIQNFSGATAVGIYISNASGMFTERCMMSRVNLGNNKKAILMKKESGGSVSQLHHSWGPVYFTINSGQTGISCESGVTYGGGYLFANGNGAASSTFLAVDATSSVTAPGVRLFFDMEAAGAATRFAVTAGGVCEVQGFFATTAGAWTDSGTVLLTGYDGSTFKITGSLVPTSNVDIANDTKINFKNAAGSNDAYIDEGIGGTLNIQGGAAGGVSLLHSNGATKLNVDTSGIVVPGATGQQFGSSTLQWYVYNTVMATAALPAGAASNDGLIIVEDGGAGNGNLIIYVGGSRYRIDGGSAF